MSERPNCMCTLSPEERARDLRSPLLVCAALLLTAAAAAAVPGVLALFTAEGREAVFFRLLIAKIDPNAWAEWFGLYAFVCGLGLVGPLLLSIGLWLLLLPVFLSRGSSLPSAGAGYFPLLARLYHLGSWVIALSLAGLFVVRVILYVAAEILHVGGFLFIAAMLLPELILAAVTALVVITALRWTGAARSTAENLRFNLLTGHCRSYALAGSTVALFILSGVFALVIALLHWGRPLPMIAFGLTFAGDLLLGIWLHRYRCKTNRRIFAARCRAEGKPVPFDL